MKTIIYGGTFNPPTLAHYHIANFLLKKFPNCKLILLPTASFYQKNELVSFYHRFEMLKIMAQQLSGNVIVSDFENNQLGYQGTYHTLKHFPNSYFVIGADNLKTITTWIKYPEVVIENKFIVFPRDGINIKEIFIENELLTKYYDNFIIIDDFVEMDISSTLYRKSKLNKYLLAEINQYINKNNLYKEDY